MKNFIYKILVFSSFILGVVFCIYAYWYFYPSKQDISLKKRNIIIGDSNTRWSMDDKILKDYHNFSVGGETYLFAYTKLRLLDRNNKIDTLLISFNPHNIINNTWATDGGANPIQNRMPEFFSDFSLEEHYNLITHLPKNYFISLTKVGKKRLKKITAPLKYENPYFRLGSYQPMLQTTPKKEDKFYSYQTPRLTESEILYLIKIIDECKIKNIHIVLIQPPKNFKRKDYTNYDHQMFYDIYYKKFKNIDFLDFSKLNMPDNYYWDINHVNIIGAEYFTNFLANKGIKNLIRSKYNIKNDHR